MWDDLDSYRELLSEHASDPSSPWQLTPCSSCGWHVTDCIRLTTCMPLDQSLKKGGLA